MYWNWIPVLLFLNILNKAYRFKVYYIKIDQNGTDIHITINNVTTSESLESVEDFIYPAEIVIGLLSIFFRLNHHFQRHSYLFGRREYL